ncbi:tRNA lysidine(34) synthetase TilS [uncultured Jatrophihabitans sp.]|uniref:tRNA lysidine(34) synthetase TilS n=1 Tax=uncultured Jatrophihabitans sp. TaxID=1610747 RepID=UPI0035CB6459
MGPAPAVAEIRAAVRAALAPLASGRGGPDGRPGLTLVACSGGPDSLALAAAAAFEGPRAGLAIGLVTIDHGLQPGSSAQAERVAAIGAELGLDPVEILPVTVDTAGGPEAAARAARYAALDAVAAALDAAVLLGHTRDDQAESVLLGLGRGSGPRSITGMTAVDGRYLRPFLTLPRATTVAACAALGLPVWDDPHNRDARFVRARLRHEVLPLLEDVLQGGVGAALARSAELMRADLAALDEWAATALSSAMISAQPCEDAASSRDHRDVSAALDVGTLARLPRAVRTRVLRHWAVGAGAEPLTAERTDALDALVVGWHGQHEVQLPGAVVVRRRSGRLEAAALGPPAPQE